MVILLSRAWRPGWGRSVSTYRCARKSEATSVKLAARIGLLELRAVGPQFRYILTPGPDGWVPSSAVDGAYPGALEQARRIGDDLVLRLGLRLASASSELMHRGWVEFARKAKIAYTRQNS